MDSMAIVMRGKPMGKPNRSGYDRIKMAVISYVGGSLVEMVPYLTDNGDLG